MKEYIDFSAAKEALLDRLRSGLDIDERIIEAFRAVPRKEFVLPQHQARAYENEALPIGHGQTTSAPDVIGYMLSALDSSPGERVLEVGTGLGYQAALLGHLVGEEGEVYTIERIEALANHARANLTRLKVKNVHVVCGDGTLGFSLPDVTLYDKIILTGAASGIPEACFGQLKDGGRMVIPIGELETQRLYIITKINNQDYDYKVGFSVAFVPLIGAKGGWQDGTYQAFNRFHYVVQAKRLGVSYDELMTQLTQEYQMTAEDLIG